MSIYIKSISFGLFPVLLRICYWFAEVCTVCRLAYATCYDHSVIRAALQGLPRLSCWQTAWYRDDREESRRGGWR